MKRKNPFRGIACNYGSSYPIRFFRHIEGVRDTRPSYHTRRKGQIIRKMFLNNDVQVTPFRDTNLHPAGFTE